MKGVIFAGGSGSWLAPLTRITNKHLLPLYDRPMVTYAEALVDAGFSELMVVTGGTHGARSAPGWRSRTDSWVGAGLSLRRYGILRDPALVAPTLVRELTIAGGQLLIDRTATGIKSRLAGWLAAAGPPRRPLPADGLVDVSTVE